MTTPPIRSIPLYVKKRLEGNRHFVAGFYGSTGSGKSYSALSLAEEITAALGNPPMTSDQIVFEVHELLELIVSERLPRGAVIVFDEVGVAANSRRFMDGVNQALNFLFQSVRSFGNPIVIYTTPHGAFVDSAVRKLIHAEFHVLGIDMKRKKTKIKPLFTQVNLGTGDIYRKYLKVKAPGSRKFVDLRRVGFSMPSPELVAVYETKKKAWQRKLYAALLEKTREKSEDNGSPSVITPRQEELLGLLKAGLNISEAGKRMGVGQTTATKLKKSLEKKGFAFKRRLHGARTTGFDVIEPSGGYL